MPGNCPLHQLTLLEIQQASIFGHSGLGLQLPDRIGTLPPVTVLDPAALISRQPGTVGPPREEVCQSFRHWRLVWPQIRRCHFTRPYQPDAPARALESTFIDQDPSPAPRVGVT